MQVFLCFGLEFPISPELKRTQGSCTSNKNIINPAGFARFFGFEFSASAELKTTQNSEKQNVHAVFVMFSELRRTQGRRTSNKKPINPIGFVRLFGFEFSASAELKATQNSGNVIFMQFLLCFRICILDSNRAQGSSKF